jgi:hypothetical protein
VESLAPFIGDWTMEVDIPGAPDGLGARCTFEWMPGERFLVQRWEVPIPEAPDGIALIGWDDGRDTLLQHYFDSRGVARVYEMTFDGRVWTLLREQPDFGPLDFGQRFEGIFSEDGQRIEGRWEIKHEDDWELDFHLTYTRVG